MPGRLLKRNVWSVKIQKKQTKQKMRMWLLWSYLMRLRKDANENKPRSAKLLIYSKCYGDSSVVSLEKKKIVQLKNVLSKMFFMHPQ